MIARTIYAMRAGRGVDGLWRVGEGDGGDDARSGPAVFQGGGVLLARFPLLSTTIGDVHPLERPLCANL